MVASAVTLTTTLLASPDYGTDVFHYDVHSVMTNESIEPDAGGGVTASLRQEGNADNQKLEIVAKHLTPNAPYELEAMVAGDTNFVIVADFMTSDSGEVSLDYQSKNNGNGNGNGRGNNNGNGNGQGKSPLPAALNPVNQIQGLVILNTNAQPVLAADLSAPDKLSYLLKRSLSTGNIDALLLIEANDKRAAVRLMASGLATNSVYSLALDSNIVQSGASSKSGKLTLTAISTNPVDILSVSTVSLVDSNTNVVLSTTLP